MKSSAAMEARTTDLTLLGEAADWLVRLQAGEAEPLALERWRTRSPAHEAAWMRAQAVLATFGQVSQPLGRQTLQRLQHRAAEVRPDRRRLLGLLLLAAPAGWLVARQWPGHWRGDLRTAIGEAREFDLPDGSHVVLNTASSVDVLFDASQRLLRLRAGEILIRTGHGDAAAGRPFRVETPQGTVQALGTRFSLRLLNDDLTRVTVLEHAVELQPRHAVPRRLEAGYSADFSAGEVGSQQAASAAAAAWTQGMLVAQQMRLADLAAELARYRVGVIRCHPALADMRVSGAFPLSGDDSLRLLEKTLPLRVGGMGPHWVTLEPRVGINAGRS